MQQIVVAGTGRSGTTWIGDVLASCQRCYEVYEPLRAGLVPEVPTNGQAGEHPAAYLRPEDEHVEWQAFFCQLFAGRISNYWTRHEWRDGVEPNRLLVPQRIRNKLSEMGYRMRRRSAHTCVIKEIRANLLLGWLSARFPVQVVYILRHPCAVVGSRLRLKWADVLGEMVAQPELVDDFVRPFLPLIEAARTPLQRMTMHWCVENLVPLSQLAEHPEWIALSYEECLEKPRTTFMRLMEQLSLAPSVETEMIMPRLVSMPSADAGKEHAWHHPLTLAEGLEVLEICRQFGLGIYGRDNGAPEIASLSLSTGSVGTPSAVEHDPSQGASTKRLSIGAS